VSNTQALCTSFKKELLLGHHNFGVGVTRGGTGVDSFRAALYVTTATKDATTTTYGGTVGSVADTGEVTGTGYTAGGVAVTFGTVPNTSGTTAFVTPSANIVYPIVTLTTAFNAVLIFNTSQANKAVSVHTFTSQTITAGTLTLTMPTNDATTGLIRLV